MSNKRRRTGARKKKGRKIQHPGKKAAEKKPKRLTRTLDEKGRLACELVRTRTSLARSRKELQLLVKKSFEEATKLRERVAQLELDLLQQQIDTENQKNLDLAVQHSLPENFDFRKNAEGRWEIEYDAKELVIKPGSVPPTSDAHNDEPDDEEDDDALENASDEGEDEDQGDYLEELEDEEGSEAAKSDQPATKPEPAIAEAQPNG
jgi:hypothetical protein